MAQAKDIRGRPAGPMRVYNKKLTNPGLAMSRSIGDHYAHTLGCSCEPDVVNYHLKPEDKILILGSDGIFEHLSNT